MIRKFRLWLADKVLPIWAKAELLKEVDRLQKVIHEQEIHIKQLNAYIEGLEYGIRNQRRIVINNQMDGQPLVYMPNPDQIPSKEVKK